jgi:hypothetical protein
VSGPGLRSSGGEHDLTTVKPYPRASSMSYDDLREHGSESAVKAAGKLRQVGRTYIGERAVPAPLVSIATRFTHWTPPLLPQSNQGIAATGSVASRQAASV